MLPIPHMKIIFCGVGILCDVTLVGALSLCAPTNYVFHPIENDYYPFISLNHTLSMGK
jgi:hypothetical protein